MFLRQNLRWNELQAYRGCMPCGIRELIDPLCQLWGLIMQLCRVRLLHALYYMQLPNQNHR